MKKNNLYGMFAFLSMAMLIFVVIIHIRFVILPVFFLALGFLSYLWGGRKIFYCRCRAEFCHFLRSPAKLVAKREHGGGVVLARKIV